MPPLPRRIHPPRPVNPHPPLHHKFSLHSILYSLLTVLNIHLFHLRTPPPQHLPNRLSRKPCPHQPPHRARDLLIPLRLLHPFPCDILLRQRHLIHLVIRRSQRRLRQLLRNPFLHQPLLHPPLAILLILFTKPRIVRRKPLIAQIPQLLQLQNHRIHRSLALLPRLGARTHLPPQIAHTPLLSFRLTISLPRS